MKYNKGFTLAEVLVTLGIIGVVAAMTMPTLMNSTNGKELQSAFNKANSVVNQAFLMMIQEKNTIMTSNSVGGRTFKDMFKPYFKVVQDCGYGTENTSCVWNTAYDDSHTAKNVYRTYNNKAVINESMIDDGQFVTADGMVFFIENCCNNGNVFITVDVNGFKKRPNQWGHDLFTWQVNSEGDLVPMGADGTVYNEDDYCNRTSSSNLNGIGCTSKALSSPDFFSTFP